MPGSPSYAEMVAALQAVADYVEDTRAYIDGTALGLLDVIQQTAEGDYWPAASAAFAENMRASLAASISQPALFAVMQGWLAEMGKIMSSPAAANDVARLRADLYNYLNDNSYSVKPRGITYATPSAAGGNTGSGLLARLTVDENAYALEGQGPVELKTAICRIDQVTGADRGAEVFEFYGTEASPDAAGIFAGGTGTSQLVNVLNSRDSLLVNSSFDDTHGTTDAATDKIPGWEILSGATSLEEIPNSTVAVFVTAPNVSADSSQSLRFEGNAEVRQYLDDSLAAGGLNVRVPYCMRVMVYRESSCDGTLTIAVGSNTASVNMTTQTNDTWEELILTMNENLWPSQFYEDQLDVRIALATNTTGSLLIDDVIFAPMTLVDGTYYFLRGGATPFKIDDKFTWTDTDADGSAGAKVQSLFNRAGLGYVPHNGTPTIADP